MKPQNRVFEYYQIKKIQSEFTIEFESLTEMVRFAEKNSIKSVFIVKDDSSPESFAFSYKGGLLKHATYGYESLEDFKHANANGFPDAACFYSAMQLGFNKYSEYKMSSEAGITDSREYEDIKKGGYIEAYAELDKCRKGDANCLPLATVHNAFELKKWVTDKKFESLSEFSLAWKGGFEDPHEYREASAKGYKTHKDYKTGSAAGFVHGVNYYTAKEKDIDTYEEFMKYVELNIFEVPNASFDEKLICVLISKVGDGKKISCNKLFELLKESEKNYVKTDGNLPTWYTKKLFSNNDLIAFLSANEFVKRYGHYDSEGEFFQKKKLQERNVILDGSNVAFGKVGETGRKPFLKNVLTMVKFLADKGFTDIIVFADASFKHRITDMEYLPEIEKLAKYRYTPAEKPADVFLITYVKQNHCLLISNDKFREWKVQDQWVALNIDYYRLSFMIENDKVIMPDLE